MAAHPHHNETLSSLRFPSKSRTSVRRDDCLAHDCQILANLDFETPFRDIYDAVDRLCPFHILHSDRGHATDLDTVEKSGTGNESTKRKFFATARDANAAELQNRADSVRSRLESLERGMKNRKRRAEEDYRFEKLVSQSVHELCIYESVQGNVGRPLSAALTVDGGRGEMSSVLGKRLEAPPLVTLFNRQKRPLLNYDLPRLNPCIRNLPNGTGVAGVSSLHHGAHSSTSETNKGR